MNVTIMRADRVTANLDAQGLPTRRPSSGRVEGHPNERTSMSGAPEDSEGVITTTRPV